MRTRFIVLSLLLAFSTACDRPTGDDNGTADDRPTTRASVEEPSEASAGETKPDDDPAGGDESDQKTKNADPCIPKARQKVWEEKFSQLQEKWLHDEDGEGAEATDKDKPDPMELIDPDKPFIYVDSYVGRATDPPPPRLQILRDKDKIADVVDVFLSPVECGNGQCKQPVSHEEYHFMFRLNADGELRMVGMLNHATVTLMQATDNWKDVRALHDAWLEVAEIYYGDIAPVRCGLGLQESFEAARVTGDTLVEREPKPMGERRKD